MEKLFHLKRYGTNVRTEVIAGIITFFTMAYIIFVNPSILGQTGMNKQGVFMATIIATVIGTLIMAFVANVPYALAPGMGLNAFFTFTVCGVLGFKWQQALALVLICGIINTIITVTSFRKAIIRSIPRSLQCAISGGIGMFIAYIGFKDANIIKFTVSSDNILAAYPTKAADTASNFSQKIDTVISNGGAVPALNSFSDHVALLAIIGLVIMIVLIVLKVRGAILIGIVATTIIGIPLGVTNYHVTWSSVGSSIAAINTTAFKLDFAGLIPNWSRALVVITTVIAFCLTDIFDTIGTFLGTGRKSGIFDDEDTKLFQEGKGFKSRMDRALFADLVATSSGAFLGTSNTTTYVESSAGIAAGGRTGLTSVVTAILFAMCIILAPVVGIVPAAATAPALIVVGVMMMSSFTEIKWNEFDEAAPAFLTAVVMPFAYGITNGIAAGFIFYSLIKLVKGKGKEVHPIIYGVSCLFLINFILLALQNL